MTLQQRLEKARALRASGYNCATSVVACFPDITLLDNSTAVKATNALGSGIGGSKEICGAAVGMAIVAGFKFPADAAAKGGASKTANTMLQKFAEANNGCLRCAQLKDRQLHDGCARSCNSLVEQCVEIAHNSLSDTL